MNRVEKLNFKLATSIGFWRELNGMELKSIQYGIEDYAVVVAGVWGKESTVHRVKIEYGSKPYIRVMGSRHYFDDCFKYGEI